MPDISTPKAFVGAAAVLLLVCESRVLLTRRSTAMFSHGAEVALPGGKWEPGDASLKHTALRETHEEVGIIPDQVELLGDLPWSVTGRGVRVKPFVGEVASTVTPSVNSFELDAVFWLPLAFLQADERIRTDVFTLGGNEYWSPAYRFGEFEIWGFTARVLVQYLERYAGIGIGRQHSAPVARHKTPVKPVSQPKNSSPS